MKLKLCIPVIGISLCLATLSACTMNGNNTTPQRMSTTPGAYNVHKLSAAEINPRYNVGGILGGTPGVPYPFPTPSITVTQMYDKARAAKIENQLKPLAGNNAVDVIVVGDTAIVGYMAKNAPLGTLKNQIKQMDRSIKNVIFTDTVAARTKLQKINANIKANTNTNQVNTDLKQLVRDLVPGSR